MQAPRPQEAQPQPSSVIDLTSDESAAPSNITPDRPSKRSRTSLRIANAKPSSNKAAGNNDDVEEEQMPEYEAENINGYFEVDEILDRRVCKYTVSKSGNPKDGMRQVVEYFVSWKIPQDYKGDKEYYKPSWLVAECLNQHSLAKAFHMFPMDADPDSGSKCGSSETETDGELNTPEPSRECFELKDEDFSEDDDDEEETVDDSAEDMLQELDLEDTDKSSAKEAEADLDVSHLENSDYEAPGTVELVLDRQTYRVGQSFYNGPDKNYIYTISMIQPVPRKAVCFKFMSMTKTFVCLSGEEESYVLINDEFVIDLNLLKMPCKLPFNKYGMKYEQEDENQRAFAYFNETGKVIHHPTGRPAVLDLFAGAGGMSLGLEKYFDVKWAVDNDHLAAATFRANKTNPGLQIYTEDLKTFLKKSFQGNPCYPKPGQVDHVHASPPCKGFSRANRTGGKDDILNNKQTLLFINAIKLFRPVTASFENVPGLVLEDFKGYLKSVVRSFLQIGYQVRVEVLSAEKYGDPQRRRRLILLAARNDCKLPDMPEPSHGPGLLPIVSSKDALQKFERDTPTKSSSCGAVYIGDTLVFNHIIPNQKPGVNDEYELAKEEPSRTVLARSRPHVHYNGERFISVREAACLQSFPVSYQFFGSLSNQYSQVGNAVPVKLSTAIARSCAVVHGCAV